MRQQAQRKVCSHRSTDRTQDSESCNAGSIPAGGTKIWPSIIGKKIAIRVLKNGDTVEVERIKLFLLIVSNNNPKEYVLH